MTERTPRNAPIDEEIRELAFGYWVDSCQRSPARTSAKLAENHGHQVSAAAISKWVERHDWEGRAEQELTAYAPGIRRVTAFRLIANADLASRIEEQYLREYLDSGGKKVPDKVTVAMVKEALAHGGFSPVGARDPVVLPSESTRVNGPADLLRRYNLVDEEGKARPRPVPSAIIDISPSDPQ